MNYESMWFSLKRHIVKKSNHGKNELLNKMVQLECDAQVEDEMVERGIEVGINIDTGEVIEGIKAVKVTDKLDLREEIIDSLIDESYIDMDCDVDL